MITRCIVISMVCLLCGSSGAVHIYGYSPNSFMSLGSGFAPQQPDKGYLRCVTFDAPAGPSTGATTQYASGVLRSSRDVIRAFGIDASLTARFAFGSAKAGFSLADESALHEDSLTWFVKAYSDYGIQEIYPILDTNAEKLVRSPSNFYNRCGPELPTKRRMVAQVVAVFTAHNLSTEQKKKASGYFEGAASGVGADITASSSFKDFFSETSKNGQVTLTIYAFGGDGIRAVAPLILEPENFDRIRNVVSEYSSKLSPLNAVPVEFQTTEFSAFGVAAPQISFPPANAAGLEELYVTYLDYAAAYHRLGEIVRNAKGRYGYLNASDVKRYRVSYALVEDFVSKLQNSGAECTSAAKNCRIPAGAPPLIAWPIQPRNSCTLWSDGVCFACDVPVTWSTVYSAHRELLRCDGMPVGATTSAVFMGTLMVTSNRDNKKFNRWLELRFNGSGASDAEAATDCQGCSAPASAPIEWTSSILSPKSAVTVSQSGTSAWELTLGRCQTGSEPASCGFVGGAAVKIWADRKLLSNALSDTAK